MRTIPIICGINRTPGLFSKLFRCRNISNITPAVTDKFILKNPELIEKRRAVVKYLNEQSSVLTEEKVVPEKIGDYNSTVLYDNKVGKILELCGDDLHKIDSALGLYGLAYYAEVKPEAIIKNRNKKIREIGYGSTSFRNSFYTYILANTEGSLLDLYSRFGKVGANLYDELSVCGCQKSGVFDYELNDFAKETLSDELCAIISNEAALDIKELFG